MADSAQKEKSNIREKVAKGVKPKPRRNQFLISLHKVLEVAPIHLSLSPTLNSLF